MKLIVPMSGLGSRFIAQGYKVPKPLIKVNKRPMIDWVVSMFPMVSETIFICREEHLKTTDMASILKKIAPKARIEAIKGEKKGPVYAVHQISEILNFDEDVIFSYCDYYMQWNTSRFLNFIQTNKPDGAIPTYTGFHPHLLIPKNLYASCNIDSENTLIEIREKYSFESDKTKAHHSPGAYYFKSGHMAQKYFEMAVTEDISLNGEYYISLVYNLMVRDQLNVKIFPEVDKFCQWGTPEDLNEFQLWMRTIDNSSSKENWL